MLFVLGDPKFYEMPLLLKKGAFEWKSPQGFSRGSLVKFSIGLVSLG